MNASVPTHLTLAQKVRLAASVFAIYWPIRIYLHHDHLSWRIVQVSWAVWLVEIPLTILFFTGWLSVTEWLERKVFNRPGRDFLIGVNLPTQLATLLIAGALAIVFNVIFYIFLYQISDVVNPREFQRKAPAGTVSQSAPSKGQSSFDLKRLYYKRQAKADNGLTVLAMLMAFYLAANRRGYQELAQLRVNAEQLKREATQAQFAALRNQVNPHFLFNSLSILSSLVEIDTKLSVKFINQLSRAYRYILEQRDNERVPLRTELDFIEAYTFLLRIRFDERLQVRIDVPDADRDRYAIAPLTLQLLVENAVKHNRMSEEQPLIVCIEREADYLRVVNPLQPRPTADESTGVGLTNVVSRYQLLSPQPVWFGEENDQFVVKIPLLNSERARE